MTDFDLDSLKTIDLVLIVVGILVVITIICVVLYICYTNLPVPVPEADDDNLTDDTTGSEPPVKNISNQKYKSSNNHFCICNSLPFIIFSQLKRMFLQMQHNHHQVMMNRQKICV